MEQLWIRIAMELIHLRYMPNLHSRVDTWQFANERPGSMERMLEQVHYKLHGTLR
jgi:hypothetical protein